MTNNSDKYLLPLTKSVSVNIASEPNILLSGSRNSGKSVTMQTLLLSLCTMPCYGHLIGTSVIPSQCYIIDIKNDLASQMKHYLKDAGRGRIATTPVGALHLIKKFMGLLEKRQNFINAQPKLFATAEKLGMPLFLLVIDEYSSLNLALNTGLRKDREIKQQINSLIKKIILIGRSAGFSVIIGSQQISVENSGISTDIQEGVGVKIHMGNASKEAYRKTFGNDVNIPTGLYLKQSEGLLWVNRADLVDQAIPFAAPLVDDRFPEIMKKALVNQDEEKYLLLCTNK